MEKIKQWLSAIKNPNLRKLRSGQVYKYKRICIDHFENHCFKEESTIVNNLLLPEAVPTLNLPGQKSSIICVAQYNSVPSSATCVVNKPFYNLLKEEVLNLFTADRYCVLIFTTIALKPHLTYSAQHDMILDVVHTLFSLRFRVVATLCEPTESNVKAMTQLKLDAHDQCPHTQDELGYDSFVFNRQKIIILYDTPSLMKSLRNDLLTGTFEFAVDNKNYTASWHDLIMYFKTKPEKLTKHNLTLNDLNPSKIHKNYKKILSCEVASAILNSVTDSNEGLQGTGKFLLLFNQLFESFNDDIHVSAIGKRLDLWNQNLKVLGTIKVTDKNGLEWQPSCIVQWLTTLHGVIYLWHNILQDLKIKCFAPKTLQVQVLNKFLTQLCSDHELRKNQKLSCYNFVKDFQDLIENIPDTRLPLCDATRPLLLSMCQQIFNIKLSDSNYKDLDLEFNKKPRTLLPAPYFDGVKYEAVLYFNKTSKFESTFNKNLKTFPIAITNKYVAKKMFNTLKCIDCFDCENIFFNKTECHRNWTTLRLSGTNFTKAFNLIAAHVNQLLPKMYDKPNIVKELKTYVLANVDITFLNNTCHIWDKLFVNVCVRSMVLVWVWQLNRYLAGQETVMHSNMNVFSKQAILIGMKQKNAMSKKKHNGDTYVPVNKIKKFSTDINI
ncbi:hypothetical protein CBL_03693 [Carabus blaptoides fortunei]